METGEEIAFVVIAALLAPLLASALAAHRLRPAASGRILLIGGALGVFAAEISGLVTLAAALTLDAWLPSWAVGAVLGSAHGPPPPSLGMAMATAAVAPLEESVKFALALGLAWRAREVVGRAARALALIAVAAGFAFTENVGYLATGDAWAMLGPRSSAAWMHVTLAAGSAWLLFAGGGTPSRRRVLAVLALAALLHAAWNLASEVGRWLVGADVAIGMAFAPILTTGVAFVLPFVLDELADALGRGHRPRAIVLAAGSAIAAAAVALAPLPPEIANSGAWISISIYLKLGAAVAFLAAGWAALAPPREFRSQGGAPASAALNQGLLSR